MHERLKQGIPSDGLIIRALEQKSGFGQRNASWQSSRGGSYQTLALKDQTGSLKQGFSPIAVALGISERFLKAGIQLGIKWPNDLYYPFNNTQLGKKVAGILCEYKAGHLLIGVGVNVNNSVPETANALKGLTLEFVHDTVISGILEGLNYLDNLNGLIERFKRFDILYQREVEVEYQGKIIQGFAHGLNHQGCLCLLGQDQHHHICHSGARGSLRLLR